MNLFISAGEASGDAYGAEILRRLPGVQAHAMGGAKLQEAGAQLVADTRNWGSMGLLESVKVAGRVYRGSHRAKRHVLSHEPGLLIAIDFGYVNIKFARIARQAGWKVLYFIPPGSWKRDRVGKDLPHVADVLVTPFPWSETLLREKGAEAYFWGHPLLDMIPAVDCARERKGVALLPGSRTHEVRANLQSMAKALAGRELTLSLGLARSLEEESVLRQWRSLGGGEVTIRRDVHALLQQSEAAVICSGTATLEAALCDCPTVVLYSGTKLMKLEYAFVKHKIKHVSLPNILLDESLLPECLITVDQHPLLWEKLARLLESSEARERQRDGFRRLHAITGEPGCLDKTASLAAKMLGLPPRS